MPYTHRRASSIKGAPPPVTRHTYYYYYYQVHPPDDTHNEENRASAPLRYTAFKRSVSTADDASANSRQTKANMKSTTLTVFSVLMVVCLTTAMSTGKARSNEELHKLIADLLENFNALDKRGGGICDDPFMDVMSFKSSNYCRRKRREALTEQ